MTRFVSGLRRNIQDVVELYEYTSLERLVHLAIKVESQISKKTSFQNLIMMAFTTLLGKTKTKLLQLFPPILKRPLTNLEILDPNLPLLNPQLKPQVEKALNV